MRLAFTISYEPDMDDLSKRGVVRVSTQMWAAVGWLYERTFKARHFTESAASRYSYQPRSVKYQERKNKAVDRGSFKISPDAKRPLIYKGFGRRDVLRPHIPRSFPTRVTINMPTPSYLQMKPKSASRPNMGEEIVRLASDEYVEMEWAATVAFEAAMKKEKIKRRVNIS